MKKDEEEREREKREKERKKKQKGYNKRQKNSTSSGASYESQTTNEAIINHKRAGSLSRGPAFKKRRKNRLYLRDYGRSRPPFYHIPA